MNTITLNLSPAQYQRLNAIAEVVEMPPEKLAIAMVFSGFDSWDPHGFMEGQPERSKYAEGLATNGAWECSEDLAHSLAAIKLITQMGQG